MKQNNLFSEEFLEELQQWQEFVPQEFFSWLFKKLGIAHRSIHLKNHPHSRWSKFWGISCHIIIYLPSHIFYSPANPGRFNNSPCNLCGVSEYCRSDLNNR